MPLCTSFPFAGQTNISSCHSLKSMRRCSAASGATSSPIRKPSNNSRRLRPIGPMPWVPGHRRHLSGNGCGAGSGGSSKGGGQMINDRWSMINGHGAMINCQRSWGNGQLPTVNGQLSLFDQRFVEHRPSTTDDRSFFIWFASPHLKAVVSENLLRNDLDAGRCRYGDQQAQDSKDFAPDQQYEDNRQWMEIHVLGQHDRSEDEVVE